MSFPLHLFISYSHLDNQTQSPEQQGWITKFHRSLESFLNRRLGEKPKIWRDEKLQGNDVFSDEIIEQLGQSAVIVSILTPRYLKSSWCTKELLEFCQKAEKNGGVVIHNKSRVFKVILLPVASQEPLPPIAQEVLGYEFFTMEGEVPFELDKAFGEHFAQAYNKKVATVAWDVSQILQTLETKSTDQSNVHNGERESLTVYLAECSFDQKEARATLESDLKIHGYTVLPDMQLPREEASYTQKVESLLSRSALSIHCIGKGYGAVPDGPGNQSVVILQNELAIRQSKNAALPRIIWLPEGTHSEQVQQQTFIDTLHQDSNIQCGADLITGDLEELKASIHARLEKLVQAQAEPSHTPKTAADSSSFIYLICDEKDRKATIPLRKYLKAQGHVVEIPAFEGDATAVYEANNKLLIHCEAVILFYGAGDEAWKRTIDNELTKRKGYEGAKPLRVKFNYLAPPKTTDKEEQIDLEEPNLINGLNGFEDAQMEEFLKAIASNDKNI